MDISNIIREVRDMATQLPAWRFALICLIGLLFAVGYLAGNVPWDHLL